MSASNAGTHSHTRSATLEAPELIPKRVSWLSRLLPLPSPITSVLSCTAVACSPATCRTLLVHTETFRARQQPHCNSRQCLTFPRAPPLPPLLLSLSLHKWSFAPINSRLPVTQSALVNSLNNRLSPALRRTDVFAGGLDNLALIKVSSSLRSLWKDPDTWGKKKTTTLG